ncbi:MAG: hypothetical protein IPJ65_39610 [Archangiaceae bacterium]|nr:hypothetical protein [Archangiaceae bacterium]
MRTGAHAVLMWAAACACGGGADATDPEGFPCDFEGRCPGHLGCDPATNTCVTVTRCSAAQTDCGGTCALVSADPANCGACDRHCSATELCVSGECKAKPSTMGCAFCAPGVACVDGKCDCEGRGTMCSILCIDQQQALGSCGGCFKGCTLANAGCRAGSCACAPGEKACASSCKRVQVDPSNCGDCGNVCPSGQKCERGACASVCSSNPTDACRDGRCWDLSTDHDHCGASCRRCDATQFCDAGACDCPGGTSRCGSACIDTQRDAKHCGGCNQACAVGEQCSGGACACSAGLTRCGATCTALTDDPANCGACGTACSSGTVCARGACVASCPLGASSCSGFCPGGRNPLHCGGCSTVCKVGDVCVDGSCADRTPALGCSTCPCDYCTFEKGWLCCLTDGKPDCVDALRCPP